MARTPLIAGNWKMNKGTRAEATALAREVAVLVDEAGGSGMETVICPPYIVLHLVGEILKQNGAVKLGAQNVYWKMSGAYTGQISPEMLKDAGVSHVILGHSERRGRFGVAEPDFTEIVLTHFGETDESVNRKAIAALGADLVPIICVGETLGEREEEKTDEIIAVQVEASLEGISARQAASLVFAYEPVWAIGTGETCSSEEAGRVCGMIRAKIAELHDEETAGSVRILYGGSMKPDNAPELLGQPDIDGGLIGGASLKAKDFSEIVRAAAARTR